MYFLMIIPAAVILLLVLLVFIIAGIRREVKEGGKQMVKYVYVYLVPGDTARVTYPQVKLWKPGFGGANNEV